MLYLVAGNGSPNFGDELIVQHWLRFYRANGYSGPIIVDGKGNKRSEQLIRGFGDVRFVSTIPRHAGGATGTYNDFHEMGMQYAEQSSSQFSDVKAFHLLGGGYASAAWKNATRLLGGVTELGKKLSVPVVATGLGIAPFKSEDASYSAPWSQIVSGCQLFECRDQESYDELTVLTDGKLPQLTLGLDDAFLYPVAIKKHSGKWLHLSGFSLTSVFGREAVVDSIFREFDRVLFWTCSSHDATVHQEMSASYPEIQRYSNERLLNHGLPLGPNDFMITGRFHPHLLAARAGLSGYYTAGSAFYRTKHGLVADLGSAFVPMAEEVSVFHADGSDMVAADPARVEAKQQVGKRVLSALKLI